MPFQYCETCQSRYYLRPDGTRPHNCNAKSRKRKVIGERMELRCAWLECTDTVEVIKCGQWYKIMGYKGSGIVRHPICFTHRAIIEKSLGKLAKMNGIKSILHSASDTLNSRAINAPFTRLVLFRRSGERCESCSINLKFDGPWHLDHRTPRFLGGSTSFNNLQVLCLNCHWQKTRKEQSQSAKSYWQSIKS